MRIFAAFSEKKDYIFLAMLSSFEKAENKHVLEAHIIPSHTSYVHT